MPSWVIPVILVFLPILVVSWLYPRIKKYRAKRQLLDSIDVDYLQFSRVREDTVERFYWAIARDDSEEADKAESMVLEIDSRLGELRSRFERVSRA